MFLASINDSGRAFEEEKWRQDKHRVTSSAADVSELCRVQMAHALAHRTILDPRRLLKEVERTSLPADIAALAPDDVV